MQPSEVRKRILRDHAALRAMVDEVESTARRVLDGSVGFDGRLRDLGEALLGSLERHIAWEDDHLAPILRDAEAWGAEREALLRQDHREQRQVLRYVSEKLREMRRPAALLARNLLDFTTLLRDDMADEERALLDPGMLRSDEIRIGAEAS